MPKVLNCGEIIQGCPVTIEGKDEMEVMTKGAEHARAVHGMQTVPPEVLEKVRAAIRDR